MTHNNDRTQWRDSSYDQGCLQGDWVWPNGAWWAPEPHSLHRGKDTAYYMGDDQSTICDAGGSGGAEWTSYTYESGKCATNYRSITNTRFSGRLRSFTQRSYGFIDSPDLIPILGTGDVFIHHLDLPNGCNVGDELHFIVTPPQCSGVNRPNAKQVRKATVAPATSSAGFGHYHHGRHDVATPPSRLQHQHQHPTPMTLYTSSSGHTTSRTSSHDEDVRRLTPPPPDLEDLLPIHDALVDENFHSALILTLRAEAQESPDDAKPHADCLRFLLRRLPDPAALHSMERWLYQECEDGLKALMIFALSKDRRKRPSSGEESEDGESEDEELTFARFRWIHEMALALNLDGASGSANQVHAALVPVLDFSIWHRSERWPNVSRLKHNVHRQLLSLRQRIENQEK